VLNRIPIRDDWNDRYFPEDEFQFLPAHGYTKMFASMLNHPNIRVFLETDFFEVRNRLMMNQYEKMFFTGPIDEYFAHQLQMGWEKLEYRSIVFQKEYAQPQTKRGFYQVASVVNYPQFETGNFTRIVEYNHFPTLNCGIDKKKAKLWNKDLTQVLVKEFSTDHGEAYYPVPNPRNQELYARYQKLADAEEKKSNVYFVGRLASYKYFNMDQAVKNALQVWEKLEHVHAVDLEPRVKSLIAGMKHMAYYHRGLYDI
jgi:UDP-galactopyranose mutase